MFCGLETGLAAGFAAGLAAGFAAGFGMFCGDGRLALSLPAYEPCTFGGVLFCALGGRAVDAGFE
jgi:hypothetical protein